MIKFGWGEDPTPDDMPYRVEDYSIEAMTEGGVDRPGVLEPYQIEMKISVAPENSSRIVYMWERGNLQMSDEEDSNASKGKLAVYRGEGVGQSVLEIRFAGAWIARLDQSASATDDRTLIELIIAASELQMTSGEGAEQMVRNHRRWALVHNEA